MREGSLLKRRRLRQNQEKATHAGGILGDALVWRMAHRRTGGRGGEHTEVTDNFASLVFGDFRKPPEDGRVFLEQLPRNFYACTQTTSRESSRATRRRR